MEETMGRDPAERWTRRQVLAVTAASAGLVLKNRTATAGEDTPMDPNLLNEKQYDAVIIGGGPAGLSAALVLGRACRRVLVCDVGSGRNAPAAGVHGFFSQDGTAPAELRRIGQEQLKPYDVTIRQGTTATDARQVEGGFAVTLEEDEVVQCRKLILATGLSDVLPEIPGLKELWGTGVFHCPYCHGWEVRNRPWAFHVQSEQAVETGTLLLGWTKQLTLLTHGLWKPTDDQRGWMIDHGIEVIDAPVERLEGAGGALNAIHLQGGRRLDRAALFVQTRLRQQSALAVKLGCALVAEGPKQGMVETKPTGETKVEGLYIAGDASDANVPSVASAVAEGAFVAALANRTMLTDDARHGADTAPGRPA